MKPFLVPLLCLAVVLAGGITYAVVGFILMEWNPVLWTQELRGQAVMGTAVLTVILFSILSPE